MIRLREDQEFYETITADFTEVSELEVLSKGDAPRLLATETFEIDVCVVFDSVVPGLTVTDPFDAGVELRLPEEAT